MNVLGEPVDMKARSVKKSVGLFTAQHLPTKSVKLSGTAGNRYQSYRPDVSVAKGGKVGLFGGAGVGKTVN